MHPTPKIMLCQAVGATMVPFLARLGAGPDLLLYLLFVESPDVQTHGLHLRHIAQLTPALPLGCFNHIPAPGLGFFARTLCCLLMQGVYQQLRFIIELVLCMRQTTACRGV